jgi:hypothetical protein
LTEASYLRDRFGLSLTARQPVRRIFVEQQQGRISRLEQEKFELRTSLTRERQNPSQANLATAIAVILSLSRRETDVVMSALDAGQYPCAKLAKMFGVSRAMTIANQLGYSGVALIEQRKIVTTPLGVELLDKLRSAIVKRENSTIRKRA